MLENEAVFFRRLQSNSLVVVRGQEEACQASESITSIFSVSSSSSSIFCKHEAWIVRHCRVQRSVCWSTSFHVCMYMCVSVCVAYQLLESPCFSDDVVSVC